MTVFKKIFISTIVLLLFVTIFLKQVSAHEELIDTKVDYCHSDPDSANDDEIWYVLNKNINGEYSCRHIDDSILTIKYYIFYILRNQPFIIYKFAHVLTHRRYAAVLSSQSTYQPQTIS